MLARNNIGTRQSVNRRSWLVWYLEQRRRKRADRPVGTALGIDLVAYFGFEEASGTRTDTLQGYALDWFDGDVESDFGLIGQGLNFVGTGYLLGNQETALFSPTSTGFTVSVWINCADCLDRSDDNYIASVWDDAGWPSGSSWQLWTNPSVGVINAQVMGAGYTYLSGFGDHSTWLHICLVCDPHAGQWRLYLDGTLVDSKTFDYSSAPGYLGVGGHTNFSEDDPLGIFDELAIWSRALSADEVAEVYNGGAGVSYPY
jgi:hypothetical protein